MKLWLKNSVVPTYHNPSGKKAYIINMDTAPNKECWYNDSEIVIYNLMR